MLRRERDARSASTRSSVARSTRTRSAASTRIEAAIDDDVGDDLLRLVFTACHPVLSDRGARRAHAAPARRAHDRRDRARVPGPRADDRAADRAREADARRAARCRSRCRAATSSRARLASVLEVVYLVFNEGYAATAGDDVMRPALCEDALRLGRILAGLVPDEPEVHGLVALMELQRLALGGAHRPVRRARAPAPIRTAACWDHVLISAGSPRSRARRRSAARPVRTRSRPRSPRATRARGRRGRPTGRASRRSTASSRSSTPSPVVELNRAVAVSMAEGPAAGLALVDALADEPRARGLPPPAERARRPAREARPRRARPRVEFERAASLTQNARQRERLLARAAECAAAARRGR